MEKTNETGHLRGCIVGTSSSKILILAALLVSGKFVGNNIAKMLNLEPQTA